MYNKAIKQLICNKTKNKTYILYQSIVFGFLIITNERPLHNTINTVVMSNNKQNRKFNVVD